jgi:hypothetical protein
MNGHRRQPHSLKTVSEIMTKLQAARCQAVPKTLYHGVASSLPKNERSELAQLGNLDNLYVQVTEVATPYVNKYRAELIASLLELASLGIFPNDIKANNIGIIESRVVILDFDQFCEIDYSKLHNLNAKQIVDELNNIQMKTLGFSMKPLFGDAIKRIFKDKCFSEGGQLLLNKTERAKRQFSTRNKFNNYHTIDNEKFLFPGTRTSGVREQVLDKMNKNGQLPCESTVLDVGANLGLVGHFLSDLGISVDALEIDPFTKSLGQTIAIVMGKQITYITEEEAFAKRYDFAILFSVLHHIDHFEDFARRLDKLTRQVLIECRLKESGKVLSNGEWKQSGNWHFEDSMSLQDYLLELFPRKLSIEEIGESDKGRRLFFMV